MTELQSTLKNNSYAWQSEVKAAWNKGNNSGNGFAVGEDNYSPLTAAEAESYEILSNDGFDNPVVCADGDRVIAICDSNGPWAVDITDLIERS